MNDNYDIHLITDMLNNIDDSTMSRLAIGDGSVGWNHYLPKKVIRKYLRMELRRHKRMAVKIWICKMFGCDKSEATE